MTLEIQIKNIRVKQDEFFIPKPGCDDTIVYTVLKPGVNTNLPAPFDKPEKHPDESSVQFAISHDGSGGFLADLIDANFRSYPVTRKEAIKLIKILSKTHEIIDESTGLVLSEREIILIQ